MSETVDFFVLPSGEFMIPRGSEKQNEFFLNLFKDLECNTQGLEEFLSITDNSEILFGEEMCG